MMGKLKKLKDNESYKKAYSYQPDAEVKPIIIYKPKGESKHVYYVKDIEVIDTRYLAEAIYELFQQEDKKRIIIRHDVVGRLEFYPTDHLWDVFRKLLKIEEYYFRNRI